MLFWFLFFFSGIFLLAYGNAMLGAVERRRGAVARNQKHSVTGDPLVAFNPRYVLVGRILAYSGGVVFIGAIVAFATGMEALF